MARQPDWQEYEKEMCFTAINLGETNLRRLEGMLLDALANLDSAIDLLKDTNAEQECKSVMKMVEDFYGKFDPYFDLPSEAFTEKQEA